MSKLIGKIERWLASRSNAESVLHSAITLALIGYLDYLTGPEIGFSIFYVIPVFALTWRMGGKAGLLMAFSCAVVWSAVDFFGRPEMGTLTAMWNVLVGFLLLSSFTFLLARVKANMRRLEHTMGQLEKALAEVKRLTGLLRVCAWCRRVRTDDGKWILIEEYVRDHTEASFSHGICPDCLREHYPDLKISKDPPEEA